MDNMTNTDADDVLQEEERRAQELRDLLSSFSDDTVFFDRIITDGDVQRLGGWTNDAQAAYVNGWIDNHMTEDELTYVPSSAYAGVFYIKGHEKPAETRDEYIARRETEIVSMVQELIDSTANQKRYDTGESCCSYVGDPDEEFNADAVAFQAWRGRCWRTCYNILNSVKAGTVAPEDVTDKYVLERLPVMEWPNV